MQLGIVGISDSSPGAIWENLPGPVDSPGEGTTLTLDGTETVGSGQEV